MFQKNEGKTIVPGPLALDFSSLLTSYQAVLNTSCHRYNINYFLISVYFPNTLFFLIQNN